jgi:ABC-type branched-subunit amino acid transport system substrate-binding protein
MTGALSVAIALAFSAALIGCSSGSTTRSTGSGPTSAIASASAAAATTAPGTTAPPRNVDAIVIGTIESPILSYPELVPSAEAAAKDLESHPGITFNISSCSDNFDSNVAARCAQQAVSSNVAAVVGQLSGFGAVINPVLEKASIPSVGVTQVTATDFTSPIAFPLDGGTTTEFGGVIAALVQRSHAQRIAVVGEEAPATSHALDQYKAAIQQANATFVGQVVIPTKVTDFAPYVAQIKALNPEGVAAILPVDYAQRLWAEMTAEGYDVPVSHNIDSVPISAVEGEGNVPPTVYLASPLPPLLPDSTYPAVKQYLSDMAKYEPSVKPTTIGFRSWASVELVGQVAEGISGPITSSSMLTALNKVHGMPFLWLPTLSFDTALASASASAPRTFENGSWYVEFASGKVKNSGEFRSSTG